MLAEALCKLEGFVYAPSETMYWQHGHSTERDYIYVTTQTLTHDQLEQLSDDVGWNVRSWYCVLLFAETPSAIKISRSRKFPNRFFPLRMGP